MIIVQNDVVTIGGSGAGFFKDLAMLFYTVDKTSALKLDELRKALAHDEFWGLIKEAKLLEEAAEQEERL